MECDDKEELDHYNLDALTRFLHQPLANVPWLSDLAPSARINAETLEYLHQIHTDGQDLATTIHEFTGMHSLTALTVRWRHTRQDPRYRV